jgi:hypothetical protein
MRILRRFPGSFLPWSGWRVPVLTAAGDFAETRDPQFLDVPFSEPLTLEIRQ